MVPWLGKRELNLGCWGNGCESSKSAAYLCPGDEVMFICGRALGTWTERCPFWSGEVMQSREITCSRHAAPPLTAHVPFATLT